jgi:hypothetical protein
VTTVWDIEAAKKCDLRVIGFLTGGISRQLLREIDDSAAPVGVANAPVVARHGTTSPSGSAGTPHVQIRGSCFTESNAKA